MWWRHYPRNHVGDDKTQFVAIATGGFRHSICIPLEVGNHLGSMISETIKLEAPNGIFHIGVCRRKTGELVLRAGWDKFVAMHHIEENYSFWFVYRGNSTFKVYIFNSNGHEKATSCSKPPSESFGGVPPAATCDHHVLNEQVHPPPHTDYYVSSSDADDVVEEGTSAKAQKVASTSSPSAAKSGYEAHKLNERAYVEFGVDLDLEPHSSSSNLEGPSQYPYILANGGIGLSDVEKKKVEEKVQAIQSALPIFVTVMTTTWVNNNNLRFCREYGTRYIKYTKKKLPLVLQSEGSATEWPATVVVDENRTRWIRDGWHKFVAENDVRVGDIALFERAESTEELRMTVYFVRKSDIEV